MSKYCGTCCRILLTFAKQAEAEELTASVGEGIYGLIQKQRTLETEFNEIIHNEHHSTDHESKATSHLLNTFSNGY